MGLFNKKIVITSKPNEKFGHNLSFSAKEAYNLLRTNVTFSLIKKEGKGQVIGLTSSEPQDGKSYTSINLAHSLAANGSKVLLIDADMRKPVIDKYFNIDPVPGFSNVLVDSTPFDELPIHKNVSIEGLDILTSGTIPPNATVLLSSDEMKNLIDELSNQYDYIIVDCPPVNVVSDSLVASKFFDGIILVVRHNKTRKKEVVEAMRQLNFVKVNILGIVYNGFYKDSTLYYKKDNYYYYYNNKNNKEKND